MDSLVIDRLRAIPKLTSIKVSLESHDPQINDRIRGSNNFEMTTRNITTLTQAGLPVIIMSTLGKHNYHSIEGLCNLSASLGARGVIFERYVPLGRGLGIKDFVLTSREWTEILAAICRAVDMDPESSITDLLPYKAFFIDMPPDSPSSSFSLSGAPCCLGPSSMALMPDGTVYPCRRVPEAVGRLPEDGMMRVSGALERWLEGERYERCLGGGVE
jgi:MoaA/NifB/PqqE/SkfB family radical SAM enzyme